MFSRLQPHSTSFLKIKIKYVIKSMEMEIQAINDIETIVLSAFDTITPADCQGWINSIGVY